MNLKCSCFWMLVLVLSCSVASKAQGDVRSATGLPIPIGASVIWGQVEIRGLKPSESRPSVFVTLLFNGAQIGRVQANDKGYYYFLQKARDGATLLVTVGGIDVGSQSLTSAGGDRYDMTVNWSENVKNAQTTGVISVKDAYTQRSAANTALIVKALSHAKAKDFGAAIKLYEQILASDPDDFVAWTELGSLHFNESNLSGAEKDYGKAIELKPDFTLALINLGKLYITQKRFTDAIPVLENSVLADRSSADSFHYLGEAYLQNKQGSKAVTVLNEAIRLAPIEKAEIHLRLATLYNNAGLKDRAANEYKLFLEKKPDHKDRAKLVAYIKENLK